MDKKLTWKYHVTNIVEKANKRMAVLKRLAGGRWEVHDTLNITS